MFNLDSTQLNALLGLAGFCALVGGGFAIIVTIAWKVVLPLGLWALNWILVGVHRNT